MSHVLLCISSAVRCVRRVALLGVFATLAYGGMVAPTLAASGVGQLRTLGAIDYSLAILGLCIFVIAYVAVMFEEFTHLQKSKPMIVAAGVLWVLVALSARRYDMDELQVLLLFEHTFLEFAELFIFLLVAMTYINAMTERNVFDALRGWLVKRGFSLVQIFWITGVLTFFLSPIIDNLTAALVMCSVVLAIGKDNAKFVLLGCINVVVAANAGGAFSPFGDITTLMVWQAGILPFFNFFVLIVPSVVNYVIPATCLHFALPRDGQLPSGSSDIVRLKQGALVIIALFLVTIATTVAMHTLYHLPPTLGMMTGFGYLGFYGYWLKYYGEPGFSEAAGETERFDIFNKVGRIEWDTLLFFYGVIMCIGALGVFGYLEVMAQYSYGELGPFISNALVGALAAIAGNIPVMFAIITMFPAMDSGQWLLVVLTAGVGGSILSIGSAAGIALMGQARGQYTFFGHLRWSWAIAVGYLASIYVHYWINRSWFDGIPIVVGAA